MARQLNQHFLAKQANHPLAKHHEALICLSEGDLVSAISALQDAVEGITGDELRLFLSSSFQFVGASLLSQGQLTAARAHLHFSEMLRGEPDESTQRMLYESYRLPSAPLNMKGDFRLATPADDQADEDWAKKYANVLRAVNRGMFRKAFQILERIDQHWPGNKTVVRSMAITESMLATPEQSEAWRRGVRIDRSIAFGKTGIRHVGSRSALLIGNPATSIPGLDFHFATDERDEFIIGFESTELFGQLFHGVDVMHRSQRSPQHRHRV